jgi:hypothetical protein
MCWCCGVLVLLSLLLQSTRLLLPSCFCHPAAAAAAAGVVFEQVALWQKRPPVPPEMPPDYAGEQQLVLYACMSSQCTSVLTNMLRVVAA